MQTCLEEKEKKNYKQERKRNTQKPGFVLTKQSLNE